MQGDEQAGAPWLHKARSERPEPVSVLTPEMMGTINAESAYQATDLVPNVQRSGYGFGLQQVVMRGVFNLSRRVNSIELDNPVTSIRSYAVERTEFVRGPATAIYGVTGSFGGEINAILKKPRAKFGMQMGAEVGSYDSHQLSFDVTGPLNDDGSVAGRLVVDYEQYGLPLDISGEEFPNYESAVLGSVSWQVSADTVARFTHYHQERNTDPWDGGALMMTPAGDLELPDVDPESWYFSHPGDSNESTDIEFAIAELEHDFNINWHAETQIAWHKFDEDLSYYYPFGPFGAYGLADDEVYIYTYDIERDGEEFTFNQSLRGHFEAFDRSHQLFAALEYSDDTSPDRFQLLNSFFQGYAEIDWYDDDVYTGTPRFSDGTAFTPITGDKEAQFGVRQILKDEAEDLKLSVQVLINATDKLQILAGALYHDNETVTTIPRNRGVDVIPPEKDVVDFSETVYKFGATYDLVDYWGAVDDARVYYSYSEGFEPQTYTDVNGKTISAPQIMEQHEVGLKADLWNGSVGTSMALFEYEITNIAVSSSFLGSFGGFGSTVLEGSQEATGFEIEMVGEVLPGWQVLANYAYMDAEILNPNNTASTPPRTTPEHSGAVTTTYEFLEGSLAGLRVGATIKFSGDYSYVEGTSTVNRFGTPPDADSHERVDLHAS
ncbi:MAG: TonB-dependent receptor, partial [Pseudomonadales bacterium]|nr:TonB-dependent receptor [Pseudomonadales bacterium]